MLQDQDGDQCCPNLDQKCVRGGSHEGLDPQILFDGFEKDLDLPSVLVNRGNRCCAQSHVVGQKDDDLFIFLVPNLQPPQGAGIFPLRVESRKFNYLIAQDAPSPGNGLLLENPEIGVVLLTGDEENTVQISSPEELVIEIPLVDRHNRAGRKRQGLGHLTLWTLPSVTWTNTGR